MEQTTTHSRGLFPCSTINRQLRVTRDRQSKHNKSGPKTTREIKTLLKISKIYQVMLPVGPLAWKSWPSFLKNARLSFVRHDSDLNTTPMTACDMWHIRVSIKILNETWTWPLLFISYWYKTEILTEITRKQGNFTANISLSKMSRVTHLHVYIVRGSDVTNGRVHLLLLKGVFRTCVTRWSCIFS